MTIFQYELLKGAVTTGGVRAADSNTSDLDALVATGYIQVEEPPPAFPGAIKPLPIYRPTEKGRALVNEPTP